MSQSRLESLSNDMPGQRAVEDAVNKAGDAVRDTSDRFRKRASEFADRAGQRTADAEERLRRRIEERPLGAILAAGGAGLLLGLLLGRR